VVSQLILTNQNMSYVNSKYKGFLRKSCKSESGLGGERSVAGWTEARRLPEMGSP